MSLLDRYVFRTVSSHGLVVLLVLLVLQVFFELVGELEDLGRGAYQLGEVLTFVLLSLPRMIYQALPMALLIGGLLGIGALASSNELVVMRCSGMSIPRLLVGALAVAVIVGVISLLIGEYLAPWAERNAKQFRNQAQGEILVSRDANGFWARSGRYLVRVGALADEYTLFDVTLYALADDHRLESVLAAERAHFESGRWILSGVRQSGFGQNSVESRQFETLVWQTDLTPHTLGLLTIEPAQMALRELSEYTAYLQANGLNTQHYLLAYWSKWFAPLTNLAMLLIGLPFAIGRSRQGGLGQRLLIGVLLGLAFVLLNRLLGSWVLLSGLPPIIGALAPSALFLSLAFIGLHRAR